MQATFYSFKKKKNSTKQPTGGTTLNIKLLDNVSVITPRFHLMGNIETFTYNYVKWNGRYYWISDKISITTTTLEIGCTIDPMASWKSDIGSSEQYVLRSASEWDGRVVDNLYPAMVGKTRSIVAPLSVMTAVDGFYVVGLISSGVGLINRGSVGYYPMTKEQLNNLLSALGGGSEIFGESPFKYLVSCVYIPLPSSENLGELLTWGVMVGFSLHISISFHVLTSGNSVQFQYITKDYVFGIPKHPDSSTRGEYLNYAPYSAYRLFCGPFGIITIPTEDLIDYTNLYVKLYVDVVTGNARIAIKRASDSALNLTEACASIGTQIELSEQTSLSLKNIASTVTGAASTIGSAMAGNIPGAITGTVSAVGNAFSLLTPPLYVSGSNGSYANYTTVWQLIGDFIGQVEDYIVDRGRPLCKVKTINSLSGFIMCSQASIELTATDTEIAEIVNYMNQGFFYE